jgi:hypothetical protein
MAGFGSIGTAAGMTVRAATELLGSVVVVMLVEEDGLESEMKSLEDSVADGGECDVVGFSLGCF